LIFLQAHNGYFYYNTNSLDFCGPNKIFGFSPMEEIYLYCPDYYDCKYQVNNTFFGDTCKVSLFNNLYWQLSIRRFLFQALTWMRMTFKDKMLKKQFPVIFQINTLIFRRGMIYSLLIIFNDIYFEQFVFNVFIKFRGWCKWILTFARPRTAKPMKIRHFWHIPLSLFG
jgi:hypothetical protein